LPARLPCIAYAHVAYAHVAYAHVAYAHVAYAHVAIRFRLPIVIGSDDKMAVFSILKGSPP
jgi:hypothetical protein